MHPDVFASITASTPAQERSRQALAEGVCVVTGQQAGLFGGPLYTLHKAASAVIDARALEAETGVPCAPVFWLQDEDHDFAEIAAIELLDAAGGLRTARVDGLPEQAGRSVASRQFGPSIEGALDVLAACVDGLAHGPEVLALHRTIHAADRSPSQAFRALIERLFAPHGLLVVDPRDPGLAAAAEPVHRRAIEQCVPIADALRAQADALVASGRAAPVHVRPGAPLSFVHPDGWDAPRYRVEPHEGGWRAVGEQPRVIGHDALLRGPHSTSALLRPILQDSWLPTAAYVGGPGELAYLAQLPPLWRAFDLPVPLVVPRARFRLIDGTSRRLLEQLPLAPTDLQSPREALLARLGRARGDLPDPDALHAALVESALSALSAHGPALLALDPGLGKAVEKTGSAFTDGAARLIERYRRALAASDEVSVSRLDRLLNRLQPGEQPQERVLGWPTFGARHGIDALVTAVLTAVVPFDGSLRDVQLEP